MRRPVVIGDGTGRCFGCGSANPAGLHLEFVETDEGVEAEYAVPSHLEGAPGIVHGGIQGTLLDEVCCMAAYTKRGAPVVTGELTIRYHRPVPTAVPLLVRSRIVDEDARSFTIAGTIQLGATGEPLTEARGRFFRQKPAAA